MTSPHSVGIEGRLAPELEISQWVDATGTTIAPLKLADMPGHFKILYCFQSWCPGCHQSGFPTLKQLVDHFSDHESDASFAVVQTVFEGFEAMLDTQKKYQLGTPFAHDPGDGSSGNGSTLMRDYRSGGTPWFIVINPEGRVVFNDFRISAQGLIDTVHSFKAP